MYKTVIFINGCFWHRHDGCKRASLPKTNSEWWWNKLQNNKYVDINNEKLLHNQGWRVITIFQCELAPRVREICLKNLINSLKGGYLNFSQQEYQA
jgi:DNA mismatch endonuclease (patch repair protein)